MLTGNGENNGLFWRKKKAIESFYLSLDVDLTKIDTKSCFLKTIFCFLWKSQRQRLNTHIVRDLGSRILLLVKFNRLVCEFCCIFAVGSVLKKIYGKKWFFIQV
jgi:hypothetical protein